MATMKVVRPYKKEKNNFQDRLESGGKFCVRNKNTKMKMNTLMNKMVLYASCKREVKGYGLFSFLIIIRGIERVISKNKYAQIISNNVYLNGNIQSNL